MSDEINPEDSSHSVPSSATTIDYSIPGMRIQHGGPDDPWPLVVRTAAPQADWISEPQGAAERVSLMVTPTTILYRGAYYRIHETEETASGWIYRMQPCPEGETLHQVIELERAVRQQAAAEKKEFQTIQKRAHNSAIYELLLGWLPARWQEELSQRWHFSPADASRKNGALFFYLGFGMSAVSIAMTIGGAAGGSPAMGMLGVKMGMIAFPLTIDGVIRWLHAFSSGEPCGFIPLELAHWAVRKCARFTDRQRS